MLKPKIYKSNLTASMKFIFLLKIWEYINTKGCALGQAAALAHFSVRPWPHCWGKVLACSGALQGEQTREGRRAEDALQSTGAIALSPQAAWESGAGDKLVPSLL